MALGGELTSDEHLRTQRELQFQLSLFATSQTVMLWSEMQMPEGEPRSKGRRVNTLIGVGMLTGLQTAICSEQDGNRSLSCPSDYYGCQLWAKPEYLSGKTKRVLEMFTHCGLVWSSLVSSIWMSGLNLCGWVTAVLAFTEQHRWSQCRGSVRMRIQIC